jgi:pimeloyl-ACP methyl ester carboxylesterase
MTDRPTDSSSEPNSPTPGNPELHPSSPANSPQSASAASPAPVFYRKALVEGLQLFYREAGPQSAPTVVLLHGFPSSSHMFRNLIPQLATQFHVIAPDYPGFGFSDAPSADDFEYTFDHLAAVVNKFLEQKGIAKYSIYIQDYGSPVGFRLATAHPERIQAIVSQNGNAYHEGLSPFWGEYLTPFWEDRNAATEAKVLALLGAETTQFQYLAGVRDAERISPDAWAHDQAGLDRPGNAKIQLELFYDYRTNLPLYPQWHQYLRVNQPPLLAVWGKNDPIFLPAGAEAFARDDARTELHLLDTGHFALEEEGAQIAALMLDFLARNVR